VITGVGKDDGVEVGGNHTVVGVVVSVGIIVAVGRGGSGVGVGKQPINPKNRNRKTSN
jgi:hypothetical protein